MKKTTSRLLSVLLALLMVLSLAACSGGNSGEDEPAEEPVNTELSDTVRVAALNGPTGMATVDLVGVDKIELTRYQSPDEAVQKFIAGEVDIAAVPSNLAPVLYNKTDGNVVVLTTVCSGMLYLMENGNSVKSLEDLRGKTIVGSGKGGTPEYVLTLLLENAGLKVGEDVEVQWLDAHADVAQALMQTPGAVALLPEPFVSNVTSKNEAITIAVDLNEEWKSAYGGSLPMGVIIAKKDFVESRPGDVAAFLAMLGDSVADVNTCSDDVAGRIVEAGFLADPEIAKAAIPRCNITCMDPAENKATLEPFYNTLFGAAPQAVGGALPGEDFYYAG
ncbi:MAG: ABC transporter substrate-binding protein [Mogibacterium sp.]|nr:ABC transporter substrate-binding protein [Mogibacterium sp.]